MDENYLSPYVENSKPSYWGDLAGSLGGTVENVTSAYIDYWKQKKLIGLQNESTIQQLKNSIELQKMRANFYQDQLDAKAKKDNSKMFNFDQKKLVKYGLIAAAAFIVYKVVFK